jgi:DNA-binding NarL/FixJ family response regulator
MVVLAGHEIVDAAGDADVVLSDRNFDAPVANGPPVVTLTDRNADQAGALKRDATIEQIDAALRAVAAGLIVRAPELTRRGFEAMHEDAPGTLLTPRELEVLNCVREGLTNKLIARRLGISLHTVKFHLESLFRKLGAATRTEAVARAIATRRGESIEI